jgi:hypothetical protein
MKTVKLNAREIAILMRQDPAKKKDGGWQSLLVRLQTRIDQTTGDITLTARDLERIQRYAFKYGNGGWEDRLTGTFGRTLGPRLGRP